MDIKSFIIFFNTAKLTPLEKEYFEGDAQNAININLSFNSVSDYYKNKETQFCIVEYAIDTWKNIAKSGLEKILKVIWNATLIRSWVKYE